jgi:hypothetical protein
VNGDDEGLLDIGAMNPDVAQNIRESIIKQRQLNRGVIDPTQVNEAASLADETLNERRENTADRKALREMLAQPLAENRAVVGAMRAVVLELLDRVAALEERLDRLPETLMWVSPPSITTAVTGATPTAAVGIITQYDPNTITLGQGPGGGLEQAPSDNEQAPDDEQPPAGEVL